MSASDQRIDEIATRLMLPIEEGGEGLPREQAYLKAREMWRSAGTAHGAQEKSLETYKAEVRAENPEWSPAQVETEAKLRQNAPKSKGATQNAERIRRIREMREANPEMSETQAADRVDQDMARAKTVLSAIRLDDLRRTGNMIELGRHIADNAEVLLNKHWGITGVGGMITRPMETLSNLAQISNESDRAQFRRYIEELKEISASILLQRAGRPLSTEAKRLDNIIAGTAAGDTSANTKRAFAEMRRLWAIVERQLQERQTTMPPPSSSGTVTTSPAPKAAPKGNWWQRLPDARPAVPAEE